MSIWIQEICGICCIDHEETLCKQNYSHQVLNNLVLEFEYDLKFTLDNVKYMLSNVT